MTPTSNGSGYLTENGWVTVAIGTADLASPALQHAAAVIERTGALRRSFTSPSGTMDVVVPLHPRPLVRPLPPRDRPRVLPTGRAIILPDECAPDTGVD